MQEKIRQALEDHLEAMDPYLPTVWQNKTPAAPIDFNDPHQKAFLLPVPTKLMHLRQKTELHSGIFQVNLCYPTGIGAYDVDARAAAIARHYLGRKLEVDGFKVEIVGYPAIAAPVTQTPYVVPVSISYKLIN